MKLINKLASALLIAFVTVSCENDGGTSQLETIKAATPNVTKIDSTDSFINLMAIENGEDLNIGFTIDKAFGEIASMDVVLFYQSGNTVYKTILETGVDTFPKSYNLSQYDLIEKFDHLNNSSDFLLADKLTVTADLILTNGTVIKMYKDDLTPNFGSEIANSAMFTLSQTFNVSCPSYLAGTYQYITTNGMVPGGSFEGPVTGTVSFVDFGGGTYKISDASYGVWGELYGDSPATGVTITDICNQITIGGTDKYGEVYTYSNLVVEGNKLSFTWINTYNEGGQTTLIRTDGTDWPLLTL